MLEHFLVIDTADADEMRALLGGKGMRLKDLHRPERGARLTRINSFYGVQCYVAYIEYGADLGIRTPEGASSYTLSIPLGGSMEVEAGADLLHCIGDRGAITSPTRETELRFSDRARRLSISLDRPLLEAHLERLSQHHVQGAVDFSPEVDLGSGHGALLRGAVGMLVAQAEAGGNPLLDPMRQAFFEDAVVGALLLNQHHSHHHRLGQNRLAGRSRDLIRAMDYIEANLDAPLTLSDIVTISGVPARTLNEHFRAATGFPPMTYLRRRRLSAVRAVLSADPAPTVAVAAMRYGFFHLGRFAAEYRRMFGETPSDTRHKAAQRILGPRS